MASSRIKLHLVVLWWDIHSNVARCQGGAWCLLWVRFAVSGNTVILPYFGKRKQVTYHHNLNYWCIYILQIVSSSRVRFAVSRGYCNCGSGRKWWVALLIMSGQTHAIAKIRELRTRRALMLYKVYGVNTLLVISLRYDEASTSILLASEVKIYEFHCINFTRCLVNHFFIPHQFCSCCCIYLVVSMGSVIMEFGEMRSCNKLWSCDSKVLRCYNIDSQ